MTLRHLTSANLQLSWYRIPMLANIGVVPELWDLIMFHPDGGLLLARKDVGVTIDTEERGAEELIAG